MEEHITDSARLFSVEGLVAVVTGGGTGIGLMIATALENNGAVVYIVGRRMEVLEAAIKSHSRRRNMIPIQGDVTDRDSLRAIADSVKARHGYINLLVNNAGVMVSRQPKLPKPGEASITEYQELLWNYETDETFAKTFQVNVASVWFCTVAFLELLHKGNERSVASGITSQVITISSLAALRKDSDLFSLSYGLSKAAVTHLGKTMAHYFKDWQIRSNIICPGIFPSEMSASVADEERLKSTIPLQRVGGIDDMGGLVLYLASKAGSYIDGGVHLIDGGRLLLMPSVF
ncbi:NAD-P-binding protein [Laetiporus sulphureus 93-53]|uniref:NAD-P-binding protein n=1 Tax=Laetiporus sulphureus 93-53 TaxID=1314785 RepID=A0A165HIT6_9APHY|nr:NAD-P-binding protein [Laetiporus sulphureus 93-53]KZT11782.1 NAD-P-binding protein [Laetiporus sulphureus 93-53]